MYTTVPTVPFVVRDEVVIPACIHVAFQGVAYMLVQPAIMPTALFIKTLLFVEVNRARRIFPNWAFIAFRKESPSPCVFPANRNTEHADE
jgi:hypothetical protein